MEQAVVPSYVREQRMTQWVENYADDIKKVCFIYLADRTQAEDALQDTFLKAWKSMQAYERSVDDMGNILVGKLDKAGRKFVKQNIDKIADGIHTYYTK